MLFRWQTEDGVTRAATYASVTQGMLEICPIDVPTCVRVCATETGKPRTYSEKLAAGRLDLEKYMPEKLRSWAGWTPPVLLSGSEEFLLRPGELMVAPREVPSGG